MWRTLLVIFFVGCGSPAPLPETAPDEPAVAADDLGRVLGIARACMATRGPGGELRAHEAVTAAGEGRWQVQIRDGADQVLTEVVDVQRGTCGDLEVRPAQGPVLGSLSVLMDRAWACGQELGGAGVGDTALVRGGMVLHSRAGLGVTFSIPETERRTAPTGMDLVAGTRCARLPMD